MDIKRKNILITGSEGFIGSHLIERLIEEGCGSIKAFVSYNSFNSWGWLDTLDREKKKKIEVFTGDIRDPNGVQKATERIDIIFHLAALIGIPFSYHSPDSYVDTNVKGALNVLQAALRHKVEKVLITSTSEVYGTARTVPIEESHPLQGQSPYSATKIAADKIAESFFRSFNTPVTIVRPFNTYGPRQSARAIIPTVISQLLSGETEIKLGSLVPKRDFSYVKDVCDGFAAIAKSDKVIGEEVNIASAEDISIGDLANKIIGKINPKAKVVLDKDRIRPEKSEVMRLMGDNTKIKKLTGWSPKYSLDKGLDETIKWYRKKQNLKLYKQDIYNV